MAGFGYISAADCVGVLEGQVMVNGWIVFGVLIVIFAMSAFVSVKLSKTPDLSWKYWRDR